ncbi:glycerol ether metabolic process [Coemansia erecta]|uniref:Thioredoxin n=1 Tax=Coemansia erecta TaxID=147472 RepID=A0A9W7XWT9_9FUNG|nr:glycerol ether metabolic process [Coemansia erecta]
MAIITVGDKNQFNDIVKKNPKVAVDFNASWCGSCKTMKPVFEKLSNDHSDIKFLSVDIDEASDLAQEYGITSMPTFKFIDKGKVVDEVVGAKRHDLENTMSSFTS